MRNALTDRAAKGLFYLLSACVLMAAQVSAARSQTRALSPNDPRSSDQRQLSDREWALYHIREDVNKHFSREERVSLVNQVKEDFRRMQVVNNQMMSEAVAASPNLNYKSISEVTGEIKKRASRLKLYLALPEAEQEQEREKGSPEQKRTGGDQLLSTLHLLDRAIMSFVTNPLFQNPGVVDLKLSARASRDLASVIELSGSIKRSAEPLQKAGGQK